LFADRETFNEYLRKEKEKELALMEAEVEELERSNHGKVILLK
jgi:hypothetical protein